MKRYQCGNTEGHCEPRQPHPWGPCQWGCSPVPFVCGETYCAGQVVSWQGCLYRVKVNRPEGTPGQSCDFTPAGDCCWECPAGPTGPTGPAGRTGPTGPTGPAGATGATEGKKDAQPMGRKGEKG